MWEWGQPDQAIPSYTGVSQISKYKCGRVTLNPTLQPPTFRQTDASMAGLHAWICSYTQEFVEQNLHMLNSSMCMLRLSSKLYCICQVLTFIKLLWYYIIYNYMCHFILWLLIANRAKLSLSCKLFEILSCQFQTSICQDQALQRIPFHRWIILIAMIVNHDITFLLLYVSRILLAM